MSTATVVVTCACGRQAVTEARSDALDIEAVVAEFAAVIMAQGWKPQPERQWRCPRCKEENKR